MITPTTSQTIEMAREIEKLADLIHLQQERAARWAKASHTEWHSEVASQELTIAIRALANARDEILRVSDR